jgi:hypothetical protein
MIMSYSVFIDRIHKPSEEQIVKILGNKYKQWDEINSYLVNIIKANSSYKFYGKNYGWALGFSKGNKSIISLYPLSNDFTIQIILKKEHEIEIIKIINDDKLQKLIKEKSVVHEGKWIFIGYSKINSIEIIKKMIDIKLK